MSQNYSIKKWRKYPIIQLPCMVGLFFKLRQGYLGDDQALFWSAHQWISAHFPWISDPLEISTNLLRPPRKGQNSPKSVQNGQSLMIITNDVTHIFFLNVPFCSFIIKAPPEGGPFLDLYRFHVLVVLVKITNVETLSDTGCCYPM